MQDSLAWVVGCAWTDVITAVFTSLNEEGASPSIHTHFHATTSPPFTDPFTNPFTATSLSNSSPLHYVTATFVATSPPHRQGAFRVIMWR